MPDITPSKKYTHDLKELIREHKYGNITDEEFSRRVDDLRKNEIAANKFLGPALILQELEEIEKGIDDDVTQEILQRKRELEAEERNRQIEENRQLFKIRQEKQAEERRRLQEQTRKEDERLAYRDEIDNYIGRLERKAQSYQVLYSWLQLILLFFSTATATMASMEVIPRWIISITGFIATFAGGILSLFKVQERIYDNRKAIAEMQLECQNYDYHLDEYKDKDKDPEGAFIKFSRTINLIRGQQMLQEVELWNPRKEESREERAVQDKKEESQKDKDAGEPSEEPSQQEKLLEKPSEEGA